MNFYQDKQEPSVYCLVEKHFIYHLYCHVVKLKQFFYAKQ